MLAALHTTAELLAVGLGLSRDALTSLMDQGPHLLGPTGQNYLIHLYPDVFYSSIIFPHLALDHTAYIANLFLALNSGKLRSKPKCAGINLAGQTSSSKAFAGYHYDLNLLVRFPYDNVPAHHERSQ